MDPIDIIAQTHDEGPRGIVTRGTAGLIISRLSEAGFIIVTDQLHCGHCGKQTGTKEFRAADNQLTCDECRVAAETPVEPSPPTEADVAPAPKKRAKKAEASE